MWHEARRREKATQKLFSDHKKRAEKRREENKIDPNSLLQVNGLKAKLHLDSSIYKQAANCLVTWQGDKNITIDRFDVRATLSSIPTEDNPKTRPSSSRDNETKSKSSTVIDADESDSLRKLINYERCRLLIQNECNKTPEELRLKLVAKLDLLSDAKMRKLKYNTFGTLGETSLQSLESGFSHMNPRLPPPRESSRRGGTAIGYNYSSVPPPQSLLHRNDPEPSDLEKAPRIVDLDEFDNFDLDEVNLNCIDAGKLNEIAVKYGFTPDELNFLTRRDSQDMDSRQLIKMLVRLNERGKKERDAQLLNDQRNFYGPALPPDMVVNRGQTSPRSESGDSDIQQRSPSGGQIPLRQDDDLSNHEVGLETRRASSESLKPRHESQDAVIANLRPKIEVHPRSPSKSPARSADLSQEMPAAKPSVLESVLERIDRTGAKRKLESRDSFHKVERIPDPLPVLPKMVDDMEPPPRRAATPLIYKRYSRSSRSLSRDRGRHRTARRRHSSSRSRSCSSSSLSTPTSSSSASRLTRHRRRPIHRHGPSRSRSRSRSSSGSSVCSPRHRSDSRRRRRGGARPRRRRRRRRNRRR